MKTKTISHLISFKRQKLSKIIEEWMTRNDIKYSPEIVISWLHSRRLLDNDRVEKYLDSHKNDDLNQ